MNIVIDRRFFAAGRGLGSHADRVFAFLERLVVDPTREGTNLERIEHSADSKLCSLRVSSELRAIALERGPDLVLLYVGHHDDAYRWARTHRTTHISGGLGVVEIPELEVEGSSGAAPAEPACAPARTCDLPE
jgi:hypothetical protein